MDVTYEFWDVVDLLSSGEDVSSSTSYDTLCTCVAQGDTFRVCLEGSWYTFATIDDMFYGVCDHARKDHTKRKVRAAIQKMAECAVTAEFA